MEFSRIFIPWNTIISSSHEIQSYLHPMNFSNIFFSINSVTFFHPIKFSHMFIPKTQSQFHSMKCRHIFTPWNSVANQSHAIHQIFLCSQCFHPMKFCQICIPWNSVTFTFNEIQSHLHLMKSVTFFPHEIQLHFNDMKFSSYINFMICTNCSYPNRCSHFFNQSNSVTSLSHDIHLHPHPMNFSHRFMPWNSVTFTFHKIQKLDKSHDMKKLFSIQKAAVTVFIQWNSLVILTRTNYSHPNDCTNCFHPITFGHIFIRWNWVTSTFNEI